MKYPIGIQDFESIIRDGYVYVDKTALIYRMATEGKVYFLSRPRSFGKSLLVSTLKYYFQGRKDLFQGLAIDSMEKEWAEYPVFHLSFGGDSFTAEGALEARIEKFLADKETLYGKNPHSKTTGDRFKDLLKAAHRKCGRRAVVLIDEYDKPLLDVLDTNLYVEVGVNRRLLEEHYRDILRGFYSVFKEADEHLQFVLLTGVTKFAQVSVFSGFNQPADISMDPRYETLCGITEKELYQYFEVPIGRLAGQYKCDTEQMKARLKRHYDGYHFSDEMTDIYNPFSILNVFDTNRIADYWFRSGTPGYLVRLLNHSQENLNELTGKYYTPRQFIDYKADVEKPLPMIYQSGYLTIKDCDLDTNSFLLDFPNNEVKEGFLTMIAAKSKTDAVS